VIIQATMNFLLFLRALDNLGLEIFSVQDAVKIMGQNNTVIRTILSRWVNENKIFRLKKSYYSVKEIDSKFLIQSLFKDTYIGLNSSLEYYGSTTQRFLGLDLISKQMLKRQEVTGTIVEFHKVKESMFFGFEKAEINKSEVFVSTIEKTIIDCLYFSSIVQLSESYNFIRKMKNKIDINLLQLYLQKIDSSVLNKRIAYLMELNEIYLHGMKINNKYEKLNGNLSNEGPRNKKWKLIINERFNGKN